MTHPWTIQRRLFQICSNWWTQLPNTWDNVPQCSNVLPRAYWEEKKRNTPYPCPTFDLFIRSCINQGLACFRQHRTLSGQFLCCMKEYNPGDTNPPNLSADRYTCICGETVTLYIECGVSPFAFTATGGTVHFPYWTAPIDQGGVFIITLHDACGRTSEVRIRVTRPPDPLPPGHWGKGVNLPVWHSARGYEEDASFSETHCIRYDVDRPAAFFHVPSYSNPYLELPEQWFWYDGQSHCFGPYSWDIIKASPGGYLSQTNCCTGETKVYHPDAVIVAKPWIPD